MSTTHPVHYIVTAERNNTVVHMQEAFSHDEALKLQARFEQVPHTIAQITEVHEAAETDLTTHTREIVEEIAAKAQD